MIFLINMIDLIGRMDLRNAPTSSFSLSVRSLKSEDGSVSPASARPWPRRVEESPNEWFKGKGDLPTFQSFLKEVMFFRKQNNLREQKGMGKLKNLGYTL